MEQEITCMSKHDAPRIWVKRFNIVFKCVEMDLFLINNLHQTDEYNSESYIWVRSIKTMQDNFINSLKIVNIFQQQRKNCAQVNFLHSTILHSSMSIEAEK